MTVHSHGRLPSRGRSSNRTALRALLAASVAAALLTPHAAFADDVDPIGHVAAAIGGGVGPTSGFRAGLDASLGFLFATSSGGHDMGGHDNGWTLDAGVESGFSKNPTYLFVEGGYGTFGLVGGGFTVGPALRADHHAAPGVEAGVSASILFARLGLRAITVPSGGDVQVQLTLGFGMP